MTTCIPLGFSALPLDIAQLSLAAVLKCGQSFRWTALPLVTGATSDANPFDMEYRLTLKDRVVCLRQSRDTLFYRAVFPETPAGVESARDAETLAWLKDYFQLDIDLVGLYDKWGEMDPVFGKLRERFAGIRMLRQDPWENLVSFICSQNNHLSRITNMVQSLGKRFSPTLVSIPHPASPQEILVYHPFPRPAALASPDTPTILRSLGFGYRAEYIQRTAHMLVEEHGIHGAEDFMTRLRQRSTEEAREELLRFVGVGRKVADCILLMSLDKPEVVPVDTHVHQIAVKHYGMKAAGNKGPMTPKLYSELQTKLMNIWGEYAGWAHSVLFTADLRLFSTYGLPTPSPSVSPTTSPETQRVGKRKHKHKADSVIAEREVLAPSKRKQPVVNEVTEALPVKEVPASASDDGNMADRVKRRRRATVRGHVETANA